jgi:hypothetical protein
MRVRIVTPFAAYWNYEVRPFTEGEEFVGDLARHLDDNGPGESVEVLEADPEPEPEDDDLEPEEDDDPEDPTPEPDDEPLPADGTAADILAWVGDDPERAELALEAEQAKDKPRSTLVKQLEKLAEQD